MFSLSPQQAYAVNHLVHTATPWVIAVCVVAIIVLAIRGRRANRTT